MKPRRQNRHTQNRHTSSHAASELSCEVCGQMPEPTKTRLTVANVAVMLPIELLVHALVVQTHLPYVAKVLVLTLTATVLVIWVAEPSAARILRRWLHAPALRHRRRLGTAPALWRARTVLRDEPGSLKRITRSLALLDTNILGIHVHPVRGGVMDEFVLSAPGGVSERQLLEALADGGGRSTQVWPTTALAMADGQTKALSLAARIAAAPGELPLAVAELLSARILGPGSESASHTPMNGGETNDAGTLLKIPTAWHGPITFFRPGEPFTPAESARAHRLAELAEILAHREPRTNVDGQGSGKAQGPGLISGPDASPAACSAPSR
ncbi:amino acid-binding protein [Arthrobacter sp. NPDC056727]|uniref:amino acid-binding protein n=1 Tax=Arthrobacter sp. NPDC056727 TaxID=3345927 RepID=UPI003672947C